MEVYKEIVFQPECGRGDLDGGEELTSEGLLNAVLELYHQSILRIQPCEEEGRHENDAPAECQVFYEHLLL